MQNVTKNTEIKNTALALLCAVTYSALPIDDRQSDGAGLDYYQDKLKELGIVVPTMMFSEVELDRVVNVGNRFCRYQEDGSFTDSLRTHKAA